MTSVDTRFVTYAGRVNPSGDTSFLTDAEFAAWNGEQPAEIRKVTVVGGPGTGIWVRCDRGWSRT